MTSKVAIVTGAGSGIGRTVAVALGMRGYRVVLAGRTKAALEKTAATIGEAGGTAVAIVTDVGVPASVDALFDGAVTRFGRVDLLFNNAGTNTAAMPIDELPIEEWLKVVQVNLTGAFMCQRAAFRVMKAQDPQGGRIVNNGSISAHAPRPNSTPYTASKHAVTGLTKCGSLDGRAFGIACGQIDIGNATTNMAAQMTAGVPQADGSLKPEPVMSVDHIGDAVLYMDSLPIDVNVQFMTVMATNMPFVGRG